MTPVSVGGENYAYERAIGVASSHDDTGWVLLRFDLADGPPLVIEIAPLLWPDVYDVIEQIKDCLAGKTCGHARSGG